MPRLKSLDRHPPHDFQYIHPEVGQREAFRGSFMHVCREELRFRKANPFLCQKYGWKLDMGAIEKDVHDYNLHRCISEGWLDFVTDGPAEYIPAQKKILQNAVAAAETTVAGIGVWTDFIGQGAIPVDPKLATERAFICSDCPQNKQGGLRNWFIEKSVTEITKIFGILNDLDVKTPHDAKLGVCEACLCPMKAKVHVPIQHIRKHLTDDAKAKLDPRCWIPKEA